MKFRQFQSNTKNPFQNIFTCFVGLCCLVLAVVFSWIIYDRNREMQSFYYQEKAQMLLESLNSQILSLDDLTKQLSINSAYRPSLIFRQKYNEIEFLKTWKNYQDFSFFTKDPKDLFLYYNYDENSNVFLATGNTCDLNLYLEDLSGEEISYITEKLAEPGSNLSLFSFQEKLFILIPFYSIYDNTKSMIILGNIVHYDNLTKYFNFVSGNINGSISLYYDGELLYSSSEKIAAIDNREVLTATVDGRLILCYLPDGFSFPYVKILISFTCIILSVLALLGISHLFAIRAYKPLTKIRQKYKSQYVPAESQCRDVFDEIETIIENTIQHNTQASEQIAEKSALLKQQGLLLLLNGTYSFDIYAYMSTLSIHLPGPFYFVSVISLLDKSADRVSLTMLKKEFEENYSPSDAGLIYVFCNYNQNLLYLICSLNAANKKGEMLEDISAIVESFSLKSVMGTGKTYTELSKVSASYLESLEHLNQKANGATAEPKENFDVYDSSWMAELFCHASAEDALEDLNRHIVNLQLTNVSLLLQQYLISNFIGNMNNLCYANGITLSHDTISLAVSARNLEGFWDSAKILVQEFYDKLRLLQEKEMYNEALQICDFIKEHFMEYDISTESIARHFNIPTYRVSKAISDIMGKNYSDYIISLRLQYAKELLSRSNLTVAEICREIGYVSVSYFIKIFKEAEGITPAKYIKRRRGADYDRADSNYETKSVTEGQTGHG